MRWVSLLIIVLICNYFRIDLEKEGLIHQCSAYRLAPRCIAGYRRVKKGPGAVSASLHSQRHRNSQQLLLCTLTGSYHWTCWQTTFNMRIALVATCLLVVSFSLLQSPRFLSPSLPLIRKKANCVLFFFTTFFFVFITFLFCFLYSFLFNVKK